MPNEQSSKARLSTQPGHAQGLHAPCPHGDRDSLQKAAVRILRQLGLGAKERSREPRSRHSAAENGTREDHTGLTPLTLPHPLTHSPLTASFWPTYSAPLRPLYKPQCTGLSLPSHRISWKSSRPRSLPSTYPLPTSSAPLPLPVLPTVSPNSYHQNLQRK